MKVESLEQQKMKILIVDDTPVNLDILLKTLEEENYRISVSLDGEGAIKIAPQFKPDLILLDVMMPGIDGYETCRRLKENEETKDIPVIFITAKNQTEDVVRGFAAGGVDYILKPIRQEEALARVNTQMKLRTYLKERDKAHEKILKFAEEKCKFATMVAHELRTPMVPISEGVAFLCEENIGPLNESQKEMTEIIQRNIKRLTKLINQVLDFQKLEVKTLELDLKLDSLNETIAECVEDCNLLAQKNNLKIDLNLDFSLPDVLLDRDKIIQVMGNFLSNAIKFTDEGKITVSTQLQGGFVRTSVQDTGIGMSENDSEEVFQPFIQISCDMKGKPDGTGLGLAISKKLIEKHNGKIGVISQTNKGSMFYFDLPLNSGECL